MAAKLLPDDLPEVPITVRPVRKSLAMVPDQPEITPEQIENEVEKSKAIAALSGFGQSHDTVAKNRKIETSVTIDTGRMMRRTTRVVPISTRVTPETAKFLRDFANAQDMKFTDLIDHIISEFRKAKNT